MFKNSLNLKDCLGLSKIDRFYYEEPAANSPTGGQTTTTTDKSANTNASAFDPTKVSDDEFAKVFDDPRLFKHDRFKSLAEAKKERDELKAAQSKAEEDRLKANQEFEKLAQKNAQERDEFKTKAEQAEINAEVVRIAASQGAVDLNAVKKLIDKEGIKLDDAGSIIGAEEAVKKLIESSPYLFNKGNNAPTIGNPTSPGNNNTGAKRFKLSQLNDARFYRDNYKDIQEAFKHGMVENDLGQAQGR